MELTSGYDDSWHRQPIPGPLGAGPRPVLRQWTSIAALWLLADWTAGGAPGWEGQLFAGAARDRNSQQWPAPPPLAEVAAIGGFSPDPVAAQVLTSNVQPAEGKPYERERSDDEVTAEVAGLLRERIPVAGPRDAALIDYLAGALVGRYEDLLRVETAGGGLHLLQREGLWGKTVRLSVVPAARVVPPPVLEADGGDAALRTRVACLITLLSDMLWVNNNNPVTFRAWAGPREDADPHAEAVAWWRRTREEEPEEDLDLAPIAPDRVEHALGTTVRMTLRELFDGEWSGIDEWPEVPDGHLSRYLYRDLLDLLVARAGGSPEVFYAGFVPLNWPDEDEGDEDANGTIVFVGSQDVVVLDLDMLC